MYHNLWYAVFMNPRFFLGFAAAGTLFVGSLLLTRAPSADGPIAIAVQDIVHAADQCAVEEKNVYFVSCAGFF